MISTKSSHAQFPDILQDFDFEETADELIGLYYGKNPPDCYITDK